MNFRQQIAKFNKKAEKAAIMVFRGTALDLMSIIVRRTPVGNPSIWQSKPPKGYTGGRLRGNWQVSINSAADGEIDAVDSAGSATIGKGSAEISKADIGDSVFITNNLPYALRVENGWSQQSPKGMVKVTVKEFKAHIKKNARKHKV